MKDQVYRALVASRVAGAWRRVRGRPAVFCFHNVVRPEDTGFGDISLHLDTDLFRQIVSWMSETYDILPLRALAQRASDGSNLRGLAALTFDDAYQGVFENAVPHMESLGIQGTVFVVSSAPEERRIFWWDRLSAEGRLTDELRATCLSRHRGSEAEISAAVPGVTLPPALPDSYRAASWDTILKEVGRALTIGSHTASHRNLTALADEEVRQELTDSLEVLSDRCGGRPQLLSYPYGLANDAVARSARLAGYDAAVALARSGSNAWGDPFMLPRINVPAGISVDALDCWSAGLGRP